MLRALKSSIVFFAVLRIAAWAQADYHLTQDPNRQIYLHSAFAHGHRHGYEEGFHAGDEDFHFRKPAALQQRLPKLRGYSPEFGDKASYMRGFESGFHAGYADSYSGRAFRATNRLLLDLVGSVETIAANETARDFDAGVAEGYRAGYSNVASIANEPGIAESATWRCRLEQHAASFCNGYGAGYVLGRADNESIALLRKDSTTSLAKNSH